MNTWLPAQADGHLPKVMRSVLYYGARFGHRLSSIVGLTAILGALVLWMQPSWRTALAEEVMPIVLATAHNAPPAVSRLFGAGDVQAPPAPYLKLPLSPNPLEGSPFALGSISGVSQGGAAAPAPRAGQMPLFAQLGPSDHVVAEARDDRVLSSSLEQQRVASYIARRYRVAEAPIDGLVRAAFQTGHDVGLDPLLLLAVIAIESGFNPYAQSDMGAQGLMQVMSHVHQDKFRYFGGTQAALEPLANLKVGALVLKGYISRTGTLTGGLRLYVGATTSGDGGYGAKVLAERSRLRDAARGRDVPVNAPQAPVLETASARTPPRGTAMLAVKAETAAHGLDAAQAAGGNPKTEPQATPSVGA